MDDITRILNDYVEPLTSTPEFSIVIGFIPTLVTTVRAMSIPGAEKKQTVLNALYTFVDLLVTKELIDAEKAGEFKDFITLVAPAAIETILGVQKSSAISDATTTSVTTGVVEEVKQTNCIALIPSILKIFTSLLTKSKKVQQVVSAPKPDEVAQPV